jgi:hypothetical protein
MMKLLACSALALTSAFAISPADAQYASYGMRSSYPNVQTSRPSAWASVTFPPAPQPIIPQNVYHSRPESSLPFGPLSKLDDPCSSNWPYLFRALPFAMSCENWDAEQFQREHMRFGLRAAEEINGYLAAFRLP